MTGTCSRQIHNVLIIRTFRELKLKMTHLFIIKIMSSWTLNMLNILYAKCNLYFIWQTFLFVFYLQIYLWTDCCFILFSICSVFCEMWTSWDSLVSHTSVSVMCVLSGWRRRACDERGGDGRSGSGLVWRTQSFSCCHWEETPNVCS